jgi:hypothetical protein
VDKASFTAVPVTDPWNRVPFIPYVYRGAGVDSMKVRNVYGDPDYTRCKRCGRTYKSKYHKENRGGEHNAH